MFRLKKKSESVYTVFFSREGWSGKGCDTRIINSSFTECLCNHLTHFAVLMDYADSGVSFIFFWGGGLGGIEREGDVACLLWKVHG